MKHAIPLLALARSPFWWMLRHCVRIRFHFRRRFLGDFRGPLSLDDLDRVTRHLEALPWPLDHPIWRGR